MLNWWTPCHRISGDQCQVWFHVLLPEMLLTLTSTVQTKLQTVHIWEHRNKIYWLFLVNLESQTNLSQRECVLYSHILHAGNTNVRHQVAYIEQLFLDEISSVSTADVHLYQIWCVNKSRTPVTISWDGFENLLFMVYREFPFRRIHLSGIIVVTKCIELESM